MGLNPTLDNTLYDPQIVDLSFFFKVTFMYESMHETSFKKSFCFEVLHQQYQQNECLRVMSHHMWVRGFILF